MKRRLNEALEMAKRQSAVNRGGNEQNIAISWPTKYTEALTGTTKPKLLSGKMVLTIRLVKFTITASIRP
jgi:hypothetical protein